MYEYLEKKLSSLSNLHSTLSILKIFLKSSYKFGSFQFPILLKKKLPFFIVSDISGAFLTTSVTILYYRSSYIHLNYFG